MKKTSPLAPAYFSNLLPELSTRAARATVSRLGFSNPALRQYLNERFSVGLGQPGCFVGEPVFEATFGWKAADQTLDALSPSLLSPRVLDALDCPAGTQSSSYRFARDAFSGMAFILTAVLSPASLAVPLNRAGTLTGGVACAIGLIALSWVLTGIYIHIANTRFDASYERLLSEVRV